MVDEFIINEATGLKFIYLKSLRKNGYAKMCRMLIFVKSKNNDF